MVEEKKSKILNDMLHKYINEADERDISWVMGWNKIKKQSDFFNLSEKRLKKVILDLSGLAVGRHIRENR